MREILFRGKTKEGKWVFGDLVQYKSGLVYIQSQEDNSSGFVKPETVGQFTGLTDKNGQKIFENDIVINDYYFKKDKTKNSIIKYGEWNCDCCNGVFGWTCDGYGDFRDEDVAIIGNIHDNPELLGDE